MGRGVVVLLQRLWGMAVLGAMGGASSSPTKSEGDSAVLEGLVQARDGSEAIPPVVARIFSGDSTSPLTREARIWCEAKALLLYQNDNERI